MCLNLELFTLLKFKKVWITFLILLVGFKKLSNNFLKLKHFIFSFNKKLSILNLVIELEDDLTSLSILNTAVLNSKNTPRRFTVKYENEVVEVTKSFQLKKTIIKLNGPTHTQINIKVCFKLKFFIILVCVKSIYYSFPDETIKGI